MPELPEVETIRQDLKKLILRKKIRAVEVRKKKMVRGSLKALSGNSIIDIQRIGKLLIFVLKGKKNFLLAHLRMTGQLVFHKDNKLDKYTHIIIIFKDKTKLFFNDLRQFGFMKVVGQKELNRIKSKYGIEPLTKNFTLENFAGVVRSKKLPIKTVLLNQELISGLGNIYADESCFHAGINPARKTNALSRAEIKKLFQAINKVINRAVKSRGSSVKDYVDSFGKRGNYVKHLRAYGQAGKKCVKCRQGLIKKIKLGGRGTSYCPVCQK